MASVNLIGVKKVYSGDVVAVHRMNLDIPDKEFMVLVGPSGCGKTTTLRMIAGLEDVTEGSVKIGERVVNDVLPKDRDIAMVFQNYAIYPHMTVYDNMAFGLRQRKFPKAEIDRRVRDAARILGIDELLQRRPKALSGGQRQRVAVGRAIVRQPEAFLFDEPLSNLDAKMRVEMRKEIKLLHQRLRTTVIYVTHDQVEAMTLGDRVCVMNAGRIEQVGQPIEVYDAPRTHFVASFIGTPPMNFLPGILGARNGRALFRAGRFEFLLPACFNVLLSEWNEKQVELGIRPEDLSIIGQRESDPYIPGDVQIVESLGNEQLVYVKVENAVVIMRCDVHVRIGAGDSVRLIARPEKIHLFDASSGRNLALPFLAVAPQSDASGRMTPRADKAIEVPPE